MSRSPTITDVGAPDEWLHNPHAGEMLALEFMQPLSLSSRALGDAIEVDAARIDAVVSGERKMDADLDLRLSRYFGMSEGFFLGLQQSHDLLEARRTLNGALDRIAPRAA